MTNEPTLLKPIRVWPGVVAAILMVGMRFVLPLAAPGGTVIGLIGAALSALAIVVWWLFFSRAPWSERLGALVLMIVALVTMAYWLWRLRRKRISPSVIGVSAPEAV